jgi:glycerol uptake facilitator-like aquaporin
VAFCAECGASDQNNNFCSICGKPTDGSEKLVSKSKKQTKKSTHSCPVCDSQDSVQRVRTIIDSGIGDTTGTAVTVPVFGQGAVGVTGFSAQSVTRLAQSLSPYDPPRPRFWSWFFVSLFVVYFFIYRYSQTQANPADTNGMVSFISYGLILSVPALLVAFIGAFVIRAIQRVALRPKYQDWEYHADKVYNAFYCFRDDTMFDSRFSGRPDEFVAHAFND